MTEAVNSRRRFVHVKADDLDRWQCRPLGTIDILDLQDRPVGKLDGIVLEGEDGRPVYIIVRRAGRSGRRQWFLAPVGDAWLDETARAVRLDAPRGLSAATFVKSLCQAARGAIRPRPPSRRECSRSGCQHLPITPHAAVVSTSRAATRRVKTVGSLRPNEHMDRRNRLMVTVCAAYHTGGSRGLGLSHIQKEART
jgi:hypothetical protein